MQSLSFYNPEKCTLCPKKCGADRTKSHGLCGASDKIKIARAALHFWEEPCISGKNGSGTIFFSGCSLKCCYCQNKEISTDNFGAEISTQRLSEIFLELQEKGAENINLVTAQHFVPHIIQALSMVKHKLSIKIVYNSGGYENIDTLKALDGLIDVYLPDMKYFDSKVALKYSLAPDYPLISQKAILEMYRQTGKISLNQNGIIQKGLIIRHLVLPSHRLDSIKILEWIAENLPVEDIYLSLMSQYTPCNNTPFKELNRRVSSFEYKSVAERAAALGFNGYMQERASADSEYTPPFNLEGI